MYEFNNDYYVVAEWECLLTMENQYKSLNLVTILDIIELQSFFDQVTGYKLNKLFQIVLDSVLSYIYSSTLSTRMYCRDK